MIPTQRITASRASIGLWMRRQRPSVTPTRAPTAAVTIIGVIGETSRAASRKEPSARIANRPAAAPKAANGLARDGIFAGSPSSAGASGSPGTGFHRSFCGDCIRQGRTLTAGACFHTIVRDRRRADLSRRSRRSDENHTDARITERCAPCSRLVSRRPASLRRPVAGARLRPRAPQLASPQPTDRRIARGVIRPRQGSGTRPFTTLRSRTPTFNDPSGWSRWRFALGAMRRRPRTGRTFAARRSASAARPATRSRRVTVTVRATLSRTRPRRPPRRPPPRARPRTTVAVATSSHFRDVRPSCSRP